MEAMDARPSVSSGRWRIDTVIVIGLLAVALLWRIGYFLEMEASPYADNLTLDSEVYHELAKAAAEGQPAPAIEPAAQRVRSVAIELGQGVKFSDGAKHGLYAELGTEPLSV